MKGPVQVLDPDGTLIDSAPDLVASRFVYAAYGFSSIAGYDGPEISALSGLDAYLGAT